MTTALQRIPIKTVANEDATLADYAGKVVLVVNVASQCGLTPQYEGLVNLYEEYAARGLVVTAFPANDFGAQEPGTEEEIAEFCATAYSVKFPIFAKIIATGPAKHPLYAALIDEAPQAQGEDLDLRHKLLANGITPTEVPEVLWNFEKFLINRDGRVAARFAPTIAPNDPTLVAAIEAELAKGGCGEGSTTFC
ncbi:MAG: glutathione peroxidase [Sphingomicrobium sp.]